MAIFKGSHLFQAVGFLGNPWFPRSLAQGTYGVPFVHLNIKRLPRIALEPCLQVLIRPKFGCGKGLICCGVRVFSRVADDNLAAQKTVIFGWDFWWLRCWRENKGVQQNLYKYKPCRVFLDVFLARPALEAWHVGSLNGPASVSVERYSSSEMEITSYSSCRESLQLLLDVHDRNSSRSLTAWFPGKSRL